MKRRAASLACGDLDAAFTGGFLRLGHGYRDRVDEVEWHLGVPALRSWQVVFVRDEAVHRRRAANDNLAQSLLQKCGSLPNEWTIPKQSSTVRREIPELTMRELLMATVRKASGHCTCCIPIHSLPFPFFDSPVVRKIPAFKVPCPFPSHQQFILSKHHTRAGKEGAIPLAKTP